MLRGLHRHSSVPFASRPCVCRSPLSPWQALCRTARTNQDLELRANSVLPHTVGVTESTYGDESLDDWIEQKGEYADDAHQPEDGAQSVQTSPPASTLWIEIVLRVARGPLNSFPHLEFFDLKYGWSFRERVELTTDVVLTGS